MPLLDRTGPHPASASGPANADSRLPYSFEGSAVVSEPCGFPIAIDGTVTGYQMVSADGSRSEQHLTEQDTFTANGKTLQSDPYVYNVHLIVDPAGVPTTYTATGHTVLVPLSPGVTFRAAGRTDFLTADTAFVFAPDSGGVQNLDAFCAALAP